MRVLAFIFTQKRYIFELLFYNCIKLQIDFPSLRFRVKFWAEKENETEFSVDFNFLFQIHTFFFLFFFPAQHLVSEYITDAVT